MYDIFNALKFTPFCKVKAVIIGQDPYHEIGQAHGLSFSVKKGVALPPSLQNIYKELKSDLGIEPPPHGELTSWAKEGVLLLNATLTVRESAANSHQSIGWQIFTDRIISLLNDAQAPIAFLLWGSYAKQKAALIQNPIHKIFSSAHPSPLSAHNGFFVNAEKRSALRRIFPKCISALIFCTVYYTPPHRKTCLHIIYYLNFNRPN